MHIVFFSHYYPPEGNAPASRTRDHCVRWAAAGHRITVITCAPNVPDGVVYDGYRNRMWPQRESLDGVEVIRVWTWLAANAGGAKRIANYLSYLFSSLFAFVFFCRRPDLVIATTPQFFCGWAGLIASWLKWRPFLLEVRDIWPESIVTVGAMSRGLVTRMLEVLERIMYRGANHVVAVGNGYRDNIVGKVPVQDRISVITNGVDCDQYRPREPSPGFLKEHGLDDRFVCSYVGTIGMAHGLEVMLRAARLLREQGREDIAFCLVGDGADRARLEQMTATGGLEDLVRFSGRLPKERMPEVLASSSCLLVHLRKTDLFETVIPSKIFEAMAMQRPLIMGVRGESAEIVQQAAAGMDMEPDNESDLMAAVLQLCDDRQRYQSLAAGGREYVRQNYSRDRLAARYLELILTVAGKSGSSPTGTPPGTPPVEP